jgi:hypothetical protein
MYTFIQQTHDKVKRKNALFDPTPEESEASSSSSGGHKTEGGEVSEVHVLQLAGPKSQVLRVRELAIEHPDTPFQVGPKKRKSVTCYLNCSFVVYFWGLLMLFVCLFCSYSIGIISRFFLVAPLFVFFIFLFY